MARTRTRTRPRPKLPPETQDDLLRRQAALTALTAHPSWPELVNEVEIAIGRLETSMLARTLYSRGPVVPEDVIYLRGVLRGMRYFIEVPSSAERTLQDYLREHGLSTREGDS